MLRVYYEWLAHALGLNKISTNLKNKETREEFSGLFDMNRVRRTRTFLWHDKKTYIFYN